MASRDPSGPPKPKQQDDELAFSALELAFFRRGDELERPPPASTPPAEDAWDWGIDTALTRTRMA